MRVLLILLTTIFFNCTSNLKQGKSLDFENFINPSSKQEELWADKNWKDPSPHKINFIQINSMPFQILNWGGKGPALIFLPGMSHTAHIFDDIAPAFIDKFQVIGITLRGHGKSAYPAGTYNIDSLSKDVSTLIDSLKIGKVILVGHSLGGNVANRVAHQYPEKIKKVIYLDASKDSTGLSLVRNEAPFKRPDRSLYKWNTLEEAKRSYRTLFFRFWSNAQEADFREQNTAPQIINMNDLHRPLKFDGVKVPQLALCALDRYDLHFSWLSIDERQKNDKAILDYHNNFWIPWEQSGCDRFSKEATNGVLVTIPNSHHYIHLVSKDRVIEEMMKFLN